MTASNNAAIEAYKKYYLGRDYEQVDLWRLLRDKFGISDVVYPGSYIQISSSFMFLNARMDYPEEPKAVFHGMDYRNLIDGYQSKFKLLIS